MPPVLLQRSLAANRHSGSGATNLRWSFEVRFTPKRDQTVVPHSSDKAGHIQTLSCCQRIKARPSARVHLAVVKPLRTR